MSSLRLLGSRRVRTFVGLVFLLSLTIPAKAQTCADWLKVKAWKGTYSLAGVGTTQGNGGTFTINQTSSANVNMSGTNTQCTNGLAWGPGTDPINVLLNDTFVLDCFPGQSSDVVVGTGGGVAGSS